MKTAEIKNGSSAAAILAAGVGLAATGIFTLLSESIAAVSKALAWSKPVGALSGKTSLGLIAWLVGWIVFGVLWKGREVKLRPVLVAAVILAVVGVLFTFPPFFELFVKED
jgi:hypothetical protein